MKKLKPKNHLKELFLIVLLSGAPWLAQAGIPEPGFIMYGVVSNVTDQTRLTSGTLTWTIRPPAGDPLTIQTPLTNINDQFSYVLEVPLESSLVGLSASSNTLQLSAEAVSFDRSDVQEGQTDAGILQPSLPGMVLAQSDRGRVERVDLEVIRWSAQNDLLQGEVSGPDLILEGDQGHYRYTAVFNDGESYDVTRMSDWQVLEVLPVGTELDHSTLQAGALSSNVAVILQSTYQYQGMASSNVAYIVLMSSNFLPVVDILAASGNVPYPSLAMDLLGTNNALVVGVMAWSNTLTGAGNLSAVEEWTLADLPLEVGANVITVQGSNDLGYVVSDSLTIHRASRWPEEPAWWYQYGILDSSQLDGAEDDYSLANLGQLKSISTKTYAYLNANLSGQVGSNLTALVEGFSNTDNYLAANLGQAKAVSQPFYDQLWSLGLTNRYPVGVTTRYPWDPSTNAANDYAALNLGQLKYLFSFEVE